MPLRRQLRPAPADAVLLHGYWRAGFRFRRSGCGCGRPAPFEPLHHHRKARISGGGKDRSSSLRALRIPMRPRRGGHSVPGSPRARRRRQAWPNSSAAQVCQAIGERPAATRNVVGGISEQQLRRFSACWLRATSDFSASVVRTLHQATISCRRHVIRRASPGYLDGVVQQCVRRMVAVIESSAQVGARRLERGRIAKNRARQTRAVACMCLHGVDHNKARFSKSSWYLDYTT